MHSGRLITTPICHAEPVRGTNSPIDSVTAPNGYPAISECVSIRISSSKNTQSGFLGEVWVSERGLAAAASANPSTRWLRGSATTDIKHAQIRDPPHLTGVGARHRICAPDLWG